MTFLGRREDLSMKPGRGYCENCDKDKLPSFGGLGEGHLACRIWDECSPNRSMMNVVPFIDGTNASERHVYEVMAGRNGWAIVGADRCVNCLGVRFEIIYGDVHIEIKEREAKAA